MTTGLAARTRREPNSLKMLFFQTTFARLLADHGRTPTGILIASLGLVVAWVVWASTVPITRYEVSGSVRLERDAATYPLQAPASGRVVSATLRVGQSVKAGDTLLELDIEGDAFQLAAERARADGYARQASRMRVEAEAEQLARSAEQQSAIAAALEADSRTREALAEAQLADSALLRMEQLFTRGLVAGSAIEQSRTDALRQRARVEALQSAAQRVVQDQRTRDRERDVRLERRASDMAELEAAERAARANIMRLSYEVERRRLRAPIGGTVGEAAQIRPGAVIAEGDRLGSIVPSGGLVAVAQFPAERALGRVHEGQPAVLRLAAYPWAEFGVVHANVSQVASEVRDGAVRVELALRQTERFPGMLAHGMPGTVEIAAERLTPLGLIVRMAGQAVSRPR